VTSQAITVAATNQPGPARPPLAPAARRSRSGGRVRLAGLTATIAVASIAGAGAVAMTFPGYNQTAIHSTTAAHLPATTAHARSASRLAAPPAPPAPASGSSRATLDAS